MNKINLESLREKLFEAMQNLSDESKEVDVGRMKVLAEIAEKIIDTGKLECAFMEITGAQSTDFVRLENKTPGVTVHRIGK